MAKPEGHFLGHSKHFISLFQECSEGADVGAIRASGTFVLSMYRVSTIFVTENRYFSEEKSLQDEDLTGKSEGTGY